jgi:ferredoxin-NADP reductase/predicted pyridoxine 5'-phosphate oxidase superfamily flavin-nucleotide-binding protein
MNHTASPFHQGEQAVQTRMGVREMAEQLGRRMVKDHMPDQHRDFYQQLPLVFVGSVDHLGRPWASVVVGKPGFMTSPDPRKLAFETPLLAHDPLELGLHREAQLGLLGLEFHTRRRNRMNGEVVRVTTDGFEVEVGQCFGNCPQYIQKGQLAWTQEREPTLSEGTALSAELKTLIESSDTFFIASTFDEQGTDVSHRGGKPGFVKVEDDETFIFPDFRGNNHFNTIGNLLTNPKAGLLFLDFQTGDILYITTTTEIIWDGAQVEVFAGAQRLIRFRIVEWRLVKNSFPFTWDFQEYSPSLDATGHWNQSVLREYAVKCIQQESRAIKSFYLSPVSGAAPDFQPGQHLPIQIPIPELEEPVVRTYSLSQAPGKSELRLTVKKEEGGLGSSYLHESLAVGDRISALEPAGDFLLEKESGRPVVFLSAGVGITPVLSMLQHLAEHQPKREVTFVHGARNGVDHALRSEVEALQGTNVKVHFRYSRPNPNDRFDSVGRIDRELLQSLLRLDSYDFYLCGPSAFLQTLFEGLKDLGVPTERIRFETFGAAVEVAEVEKREVEFRRSGKIVTWEGGSLLELAEKAGISAPSSCRSGACGSCSARLFSGEVDYLRKPSFPVAEGEALLCSARPRPVESSGEPLIVEL